MIILDCQYRDGYFDASFVPGGALWQRVQE
jgi:hypothetical protein